MYDSICGVCGEALKSNYVDKRRECFFGRRGRRMVVYGLEVGMSVAAFSSELTDVAAVCGFSSI